MCYSESSSSRSSGAPVVAVMVVISDRRSTSQLTWVHCGWIRSYRNVLHGARIMPAYHIQYLGDSDGLIPLGVQFHKASLKLSQVEW